MVRILTLYNRFILTVTPDFEYYPFEHNFYLVNKFAIQITAIVYAHVHLMDFLGNLSKCFGIRLRYDVMACSHKPKQSRGKSKTLDAIAVRSMIGGAARDPPYPLGTTNFWISQHITSSTGGSGYCERLQWLRQSPWLLTFGSCTVKVLEIRSGWVAWSSNVAVQCQVFFRPKGSQVSDRRSIQLMQSAYRQVI